MRKFWIVAIIALFISIRAFGQEPQPEAYIPEHVEIREHGPAGVLDDWWMRVSRPLIWHVTPAFDVIPAATDYEACMVIRSATRGFLIRWPNPPEWRSFPWSLVQPKAHFAVIDEVTNEVTLPESFIAGSSRFYTDLFQRRPKTAEAIAAEISYGTMTGEGEEETFDPIWTYEEIANPSGEYQTIRYRYDTIPIDTWVMVYYLPVNPWN